MIVCWTDVEIFVPSFQSHVKYFINIHRCACDVSASRFTRIDCSLFFFFIPLKENLEWSLTFSRDKSPPSIARKGYRATTTFVLIIILSWNTRQLLRSNYLFKVEVNCVEKYVTLVLEDGVPGVPPGIIGVEGVPVTQKLQSSVNHRFVQKQKFQIIKLHFIIIITSL